MCNLIRVREGLLLTRVEPWPVAIADGIHDTVAVPDAAAALASPPAAALLASSVPSPPPSLLLHPPSMQDQTPSGQETPLTMESIPRGAAADGIGIERYIRERFVLTSAAFQQTVLSDFFLSGCCGAQAKHRSFKSQVAWSSRLLSGCSFASVCGLRRHG